MSCTNLNTYLRPAPRPSGGSNQLSASIPLEVATCVRKYFLGNDLSHQWRDILAFFASGMARMPRLTNRYNDRSHSPPSACVTFIHCASYGASHEVWVAKLPAEVPRGKQDLPG